MARRNIVMLAAALGCAAALAFSPFLQPQMVTLVGAQLFKLHSVRGVVLLLGSLLGWGLLTLLSYLPLGALCALVFARRGEATQRSLPAFALALTLGYAVAALRTGWAVPSPWALGLAWAGSALGAWLTLSWRRGPRARRLIVPKLLAGLLALGLVTCALAWLSLEAEPAVAERAHISPEQRRELIEAVRGRDPRKIPEGETRSVTLTSAQLDAAVAWAANAGLRARSQLGLMPGGVRARASLRVPGTQRWLNVEAASQVSLEDGALTLSSSELSLGRLRVPSFLLWFALRGTLASLYSDPDIRTVLTALRELSIESSAATLTYAGLSAPTGLAARLMFGEKVHERLGTAVQTHVAHLLKVLAPAPAGDARFLLALRTTFEAARRQSSAQTAAEQNRAALIALGVVLGHSKLVRAIGERLDDDTKARIDEVRNGTTVRGRNDWVRHFTVSALLTVLSDVAPSDALGLLKEELDSDGGSGFSFADLLADRAGTSLAERAVDPAHAERMQQRLTGELQVDDVFPSVEGLPENLPEAELLARYGGVKGPGFRALTAQIEQRVQALPVLSK